MVSPERDRVPVGVDRIDRDGEGAAGGLGARRAGLAGCGAGRGGLAGRRIWSLLNAAALIVVAGLVLAVIPPFVMSVAVKVFEPAVFGVTPKVFGAGDEGGVGRQRRVGSVSS